MSSLSLICLFKMNVYTWLTIACLSTLMLTAPVSVIHACEEEQANAQTNAPAQPTAPNPAPIDWNRAAPVPIPGTAISFEETLATAFSPDGQTLAVSGHNYARSTGGEAVLFLRDLQTGVDRQLLRSGLGEVALRSTPLPIAEEPYGYLTWLYGNRAPALAFSPDGKILVAGMADHTIQLWDVATATPLRTLQSHDYAVHAIAITPDGKTLISASSDSTIKIWDLNTGELRQTLGGQEKAVTAIAISSDGTLFASGNLDHTIRLWNLQTGLPFQTYSEEDTISSLAFSPDGKRLVSTRSTSRRSVDGYTTPSIKVWELEARSAIDLLADTTVYPAYGAQFSPDGQTLAAYVSSEQGGTVQLWDMTTGAKIRTISRAGTPTTFSPIAPRFLVGMQLWEIK